ncbi:MAG: shikimate dehydrogenase family protein [Bacteroidia bacterium]
MVQSKRAFGLIGSVVAHSFSPMYFERTYGVKYEAVALSSLEGIREKVVQWGWEGFNLTVSHKENILSFVWDLDSVARQVGAVNCVHITPRGWMGYNTDAQAIDMLTEEIFPHPPAWVWILGTGGTARAAAWAFQKRGWQGAFLSRRKSRILMGWHVYGYEDFPQAPHPWLIFQATPLGMFPHVYQMPPFSVERIQKHDLIWDAIYIPEPTYFLQQAYQRGAYIFGGRQMWLKQAQLSAQIWGLWEV